MPNQKNKRNRILLADEQELVRAGLQMMLQSESGLELVGVANNFEDTLLLSQKHLPDIVFFDYLIGENNCRVQGVNCRLQEGNYIKRLPEILNMAINKPQVAAKLVGAWRTVSTSD